MVLEGGSGRATVDSPAALTVAEGKMVSGYSSPLYEERLKDWYREERINYAQNAQQRREVIWCNQKTEKTAQQLTLF